FNVIRCEAELVQPAGSEGDLCAGRRGIRPRVVVRADVVGVTDVAVPALAIVLPDELPVRIHEVLPTGRDFRPLEALWGEHRLELSTRSGEGRGLLCDGDEDEAADLLDVNRQERKLVTADPSLAVDPTAGSEGSVEPVRPLVVRADDRPLESAFVPV